MNWKAHVPVWITLPLLGGVAVGALVLVGNIKSYLDPISSLSTIYRVKPVPVKVTEVKWMTKVKKETIQVPVEVIREVPAKVEKQLLGFGLNLKDLHAENKELVDVLDVPKAPHGGEMALTVNTGTGKIEGTFKAKQSPLIEFGGLREAGVDFNVIQRGVTGYYRQDLVRIGPAIINGKVFATAPLSPGTPPTYGAMVGVAVRF